MKQKKIETNKIIISIETISENKYKKTIKSIRWKCGRLFK